LKSIEKASSVAKLLYREMDGRYVYMATGVTAATDIGGILLFHDPSFPKYLEEAQSL